MSPHDDHSTPPDWLAGALELQQVKPRGFLFLCVANSARSQMAEGIARMLAPEGVRVQSAGSHPTRLRPEAATVLAELGIDTAAQRAKSVTEIDPAAVDAVITLCSEEACPVFLGDAIRLDWGLPDPAAVAGDEQARLHAFRQARDELLRRLEVVFGKQTQ